MWIDIKDKKPKRGQQVLCCNEDNRVFVSAITYISDTGRPYFGKHYGVTHWQELPLPPDIENKSKQS